MHTIREQKEYLGEYCGHIRQGPPTGKWEVITIHYASSAFGAGGIHIAAVCDNREEAISICSRLNGGKE